MKRVKVLEDGTRLRTGTSRFILNLDASPTFRRRLADLVFILGLATWLLVQGTMMTGPLLTRATFPEVDDILGYLVKTRQMSECFFQDCPALEDLRGQLLVKTQDPAAQAELDLAATRVLPVYHFLFSAVLLGLTQFGLDLTSAYKALWLAAPLFFALSLAYFLSAIWGRAAAGLALGFLAFKVFPGTGLNYVVPSNLAMGLAVLVLARILAKGGRAPLALIVGALLLTALHPVGRIYALLAVILVLWLTRPPRGWKVWTSAAVSLLIIVLAFVVFAVVKRPYLLNLSPLPAGDNLFYGFLAGAGASIIEIAGQILRVQDGLWGSLPIFLGAVTYGFLLAPAGRRRPALILTVIYLVFLAGLLFYGPTQPADAFLRLWIPLVVLLFGALGQAWWGVLAQGWGLLVEYARPGPKNKPAYWPVVALAVLAGYSAYMMTCGAEQIYAQIQYLQQKEPLKLDPAQPRRLLAQARPGDRVLYISMILMPYFLSQGAMQLGAVYYHPALEEVQKKWLEKPDLKFAVAYNPTVYHPSFEGAPEHLWWITSPEFRYSPLSRPRKHGPVSREGLIPARNYHWIEVRPQGTSPGFLKLWLENPGRASIIELLPCDRTGFPLRQLKTTAVVPAGWSGWLRLEIKQTDHPGLRLVFPAGGAAYRIGGLIFGDSGHFWPWDQKAEMIFSPRDPGAGPITISFDPARILPPPLNQSRITVLADTGSSVLFRMDR
ncbi:MAG: hypothetical protein V1742_12665 [Pseudomonadota bacterium]